MAALEKGSDFSYDGKKNEANPNPTYNYEKTIHITSSDAKGGYDISFDASYSLNDGPRTYEWDWEYVNDVEWDEPEAPPFDVDDTDMVVTHTFYPEISFLSPDDIYVGLCVKGDKVIEKLQIDGSKQEELESNIKIIHLEFILTLTTD